MRFVPPIAYDDGTGRYRDANPALGQRGSWQPAEFFNAVGDELAGLIAAAGLAPSAADLAQVAKAIQSGRLIVATNLSTSTNAITGNLPVPAPSYPAGMGLVLVVGGTNAAGPVTLALNGGAARSILRRDGTPLEAGDLPGYAALVSDGPAWRVQGLVASDIAKLIGVNKALSNIQALTSSTRTTISNSVAGAFSAAFSGTYVKKSATSNLWFSLATPSYVGGAAGPTILQLAVASVQRRNPCSNNTPSTARGSSVLTGVIPAASLSAASLSWGVSFARFDATAWAATINPTSADDGFLPAATVSDIIFGEFEP